MPRPIPRYQWGIQEGQPLKGEAHSHRMKGKAKGKGYKTDTVPRSLPTVNSQHVRDVHFGSHRSIEHQIRDEMLRLGL